MEGYVPRTLEEALEIKAAHHDAVPVAGGTDLMVEVNARRKTPAALLDLSRVDELREWGRENGSLRIGAGVTFARIARELRSHAALAQAALSVGAPEIRTRATLGGNLATASPAGDALLPLAAGDAEVLVAAAGGARRSVRWREFLRGPKQNALEPDELITGVRFAVADGPGAFAKVGPRNANVIAVAGVCVQLDEAVRRVRVALGSVAPTIVRASDAEIFAAAVIDWDGGSVLGETSLQRFAELVAASASPIDDLRGSATYRRLVVGALARRLLAQTLGERETRC